MPFAIGRVLASSLNLRQGPNTDRPPKGHLLRGEEVMVLEDRGDWLQIRRRDAEGFVAARFVRVSGQASPLLVDASHHNGQPMWPRLADDPRFCGAMLKATEATEYRFADWFKQHWNNLKTAGGERYGTSWFRAAYHYLRFAQPGDVQADYFLQVVEEAGGFGPGDLPPVVDVELGRADSSNRQASAQQVIECTRAFVRRIAERTGRPTILYGRGAMRDLGIRDDMDCRYLWNPGYTRDMPSTAQFGWPSERVLFWQYTNGGAPEAAEPIGAPGLGPCDISRFLGGDLEALGRLCHERADQAPPQAELWSVRKVQERLTELGYNPGFIDGIDGAITRAALDAFRREHEIDARGPLDALTQSMLQEAQARAPVASPALVSNAALAATKRFVNHPQLEARRYRPMVRALADYFEQVRGDMPVEFPERVARTAEWFLDLDIRERGGQNRGPWVEFIRGIGRGAPDAPQPWCASFSSSCLRIAQWAGDYPDLDLCLSASATRLYIDAPEPARIPRDRLDLEQVRGSIFVRTRSSDDPERRDLVLRGFRTRGHTGVVVGGEGQSLVAIAGNSSGAGHSRVPNSGAVAIEKLGQGGSVVAGRAWERLVGLVRYDAPAPAATIG